jgi:two-component system, chemotaxis family, sensor kinase Cph1
VLRVEISALRDSQEWVVTVCDNGVGIDRADASRIFGMFFRPGNETEGVVIGLAVCRRRPSGREVGLPT